MAQLTIPSASREVEYTIVNPTSFGPFTVPFPFYNVEDVQVSHTAADGTKSDYVLLTDFFFNALAGPAPQEGLGGYIGGEITLYNSVGDGVITIYSSVVIDRLNNYPTTGPFSVALLNDELNKHITIMQELKRDKDTYLSLPEGSADSEPFDAAARAICNLGESSDGGCAATNRQVDANGPNFLSDNDIATAIGTVDQWNTVVVDASIVIEGNDTTKLFDLLTQFYTTIQNRGGAEASFYIRYRYQVDCYSEITKVGNSSYPIRIAPTSAIPFNFMDIARDIDYTNGNCTLQVALDIFPIGSSSASLYAEWKNLAVNTSEPR